MNWRDKNPIEFRDWVYSAVIKRNEGYPHVYHGEPLDHAIIRTLDLLHDLWVEKRSRMGPPLKDLDDAVEVVGKRPKKLWGTCIEISESRQKTPEEAARDENVGKVIETSSRTVPEASEENKERAGYLLPPGRDWD